MPEENFIFCDGGRAASGFKGKANDCVARAIAIAARIDYAQVYADLATRNKAITGKKSARERLSKAVYESYLEELGFVWCAAPKLEGRKARTSDLPPGRLIARQAHHLVAVVNGVARDTENTTHKMVYGFWRYTREKDFA